MLFQGFGVWALWVQGLGMLRYKAEGHGSFCRCAGILLEMPLQVDLACIVWRLCDRVMG